jgi:hypothetical protein
MASALAKIGREPILAALCLRAVNLAEYPLRAAVLAVYAVAIGSYLERRF